MRFPVGLWTDGRQIDGRGPQTVPCERYEWRSDVVRSGRACRTTPRVGQVKLYERRATGYHTVGRVWRRWSSRPPHERRESVAAVAVVSVAVAAAATGNTRARVSVSGAAVLSGTSVCTSRWPSVATVVCLDSGKRFSDWHRVIRRRRNRARETQTISHCYQMRP